MCVCVCVCGTVFVCVSAESCACVCVYVAWCLCVSVFVCMCPGHFVCLFVWLCVLMHTRVRTLYVDVKVMLPYLPNMCRLLLPARRPPHAGRVPSAAQTDKR